MIYSTLTDDEIHAILDQAADNLMTMTESEDLAFPMSYSSAQLVAEDDGWVQVGWLYSGMDRDAWNVDWHPETGERRMRKLSKLGR